MHYYFLDKSSDDLIRNYYTNSIIEENKPIVKKINNEVKEEYLGILKIPKIGLEEGFYQINSKNNNINKSVTILDKSILPNNNGGVIYLSAHSGYGYLAFFKNLDQLMINDHIYLYLNNHDYQYIVNDIYEIEKNGKITVDHNISENILVLTTCSRNKNKQLVVTSKLILNNNVE